MSITNKISETATEYFTITPISLIFVLKQSPSALLVLQYVIMRRGVDGGWKFRISDIGNLLSMSEITVRKSVKILCALKLLNLKGNIGNQYYEFNDTVYADYLKVNPYKNLARVLKSSTSPVLESSTPPLPKSSTSPVLESSTLHIIERDNIEKDTIERESIVEISVVPKSNVVERAADYMIAAATPCINAKPLPENLGTSYNNSSQASGTFKKDFSADFEAHFGHIKKQLNLK